MKPGPAWPLSQSLALLLAASFSPAASADEPGPLTPAQSLNAIHTRPDMQVELMASEPLVRDPVAIAWGPDGRLWVAEMGDYPLGADGQNKPDGRIRFLEDTDGDGRYDRSVVFLDGLSFPTGVLPWLGTWAGDPRGKDSGAKVGDVVLVTCAPELFVAADTDGDGRADRRDVLFTGFPERNQQHRVNGLRWGLDNWVYCANGDGGVGGETQIECLVTGETIALGGRDFRFRPETGRLDPATGRTQFGRYRDDWGAWFGCNNAQPLYHFVLPDRYLRRNARLAPIDPRVQVVPGARGPLYGLARPVTVRGKPAEERDVYVTGFTSACSAAVYRDDLLGPAFAGNVFICDPATSLVHRRVLEPQGVTFASHRADDEPDLEFFASRDSWTRPVAAVAGPDGALWVVDMYRLVIEHPQWIDAAIKQSVDLRAGHDRGRIWRVYPFDKRPRPMPRLDKLDLPHLVAALDSPSGWQRDMVQQMLLARRDPAAVGPLRTLAQQSENPLARLHALATLDGLGQLDAELLQSALADAHPGVRRNAVRMCEPVLSGENPAKAKLADALLAMLDDADSGVALQLAFTLGELDDGRVADALATLALGHGDDPYLTAAVLSSLKPEELPAMIAAIVKRAPQGGPPMTLVEQLLAMTQLRAHPDALAELIDRITAPSSGGEKNSAPWQWAALSGLLQSLEREASASGGAAVPALPASARQRLAALWSAAREKAGDADGAPDDRLVAMRLLAHSQIAAALAAGDDKETAAAATALDIEALAGLLAPQTAIDLQLAATEALTAIDDERSAAALLAPWAAMSPAVRSRALDGLLSRPASTAWLLQALASGNAIRPSDFDAPRRRQLLEHANKAIRQRAAQLLGSPTNPDRAKVIEQYQAALKLTGDAAHGRTVFEKRCSVCHRLGELGHQVGPDLAAWTTKPTEDMLTAVLDPNRAIESRYLSYAVATQDGRVLSGILAAETANSITLLAADGKSHTLLRSDIDALRSTGKSLMPEGLEKDVTPQDFADVAAFVRAAAPSAPQPVTANAGSPKTVAGNKPALVRPDADGAVHLLAATCELYGQRTGINVENRCIAWMAGPGDRAVWTLELAKPGVYDVAIDWAQIDANDGNAFVVESGDRQITGKFPSTGGWEHYRLEKFGRLELPAGRHLLTLRPLGAVKSELSDVREVRLTPADD